MTHVRGRDTIRQLIEEEALARPRLKAEQLWCVLQEKYPGVHFSWNYVRRIKTSPHDLPKG